MWMGIAIWSHLLSAWKSSFINSISCKVNYPVANFICFQAWISPWFTLFFKKVSFCGKSLGALILWTASLSLSLWKISLSHDPFDWAEVMASALFQLPLPTWKNHPTSEPEWGWQARVSHSAIPELELKSSCKNYNWEYY